MSTTPDLRSALAAPAQPEAQAVYAEARECNACNHVGINDSHSTNAACTSCDWSGNSPVEDICPGCGRTGSMSASCPDCGGYYRLLAHTDLAAPQPEPRKALSAKDVDAVCNHWLATRSTDQYTSDRELVAAAIAKFCEVNGISQPAAAQVSDHFPDARKKVSEAPAGAVDAGRES